ncbi:BMA-RIG-1, isoform b [Dirofilaria immitis]|nr:BMA-RIG-1, isoform b [Dirofilaria immitis]
MPTNVQIQCNNFATYMPNDSHFFGKQISYLHNLGIFKLPRLILHADQYYLVKRKAVDMSCQIEPGWRGATMADVHWIKDGIPISELENENMRNELLIDGPTLKIQNGKYHAEGDYQCSALIRGVRLSNGKHIDTRLVSAPVKFRRARITKFEKVAPESMAVFQGQIARLPCSGMPDVIPGPPEITFEKEGHGKLLGIPGNGDERYLSTSSGMQISFSKLSDSGSYYCVVRNTFTNQTRRSPYFVKLEVLAKRYNSIEPVLVYPVTLSSINGPIIIDVVKGQTALLECIVTSAKIIWTRLYAGETEISVSSERIRLRQIWGNLQIQQVNEADTGIYICESMALLSHTAVEFPKVYYNLRVHAPTDVQLMLGQLAADKNWKLSCLALNLHYEIPMCCTIRQCAARCTWSLCSQPHISCNKTFRDSYHTTLQCISRPAMDEAEVYRNGLERGRAMNLWQTYGANWKKRIRLIGTASLQISDVQLEDEGWYTCEVTDNTNHMTRSTKKVLLQDEKESGMENRENILSDNSVTQYQNEEEEKLQTETDVSKEFSINTPHAFISGRSVRVLWSLPKSYSFSNKIASFQIEFRTESSDKKWIVGDVVDGNVRGVILKALLPINRYQFRVLMKMLDQSIITSRPTGWLKIEKAFESGDEMLSNSSFLMTNLSDLLPSTEYQAIVEIEFADETSQPSELSVARTLAARGKFMDTSHRIFNEQRVQKSHLYYEPGITMSAISDMNEFIPLNMKEKKALASLKKHSNTQKPVQRALQTDDSHDKSLWLKAAARNFTRIINNDEIISPNHSASIPSGAQLLVSNGK